METLALDVQMPLYFANAIIDQGYEAFFVESYFHIYLLPIISHNVLSACFFPLNFTMWVHLQKKSQL